MTLLIRKEAELETFLASDWRDKRQVRRGSDFVVEPDNAFQSSQGNSGPYSGNLQEF